jgi:uncharacterized membrane protein
VQNYIAVVLDNPGKAYEGLRAMWQLDRAGAITVHGSTVIHRDTLGQVQVDTKETQSARCTTVGVGIGALLGVLAGPCAGSGYADGGAGSTFSDGDTHVRAMDEARFVLGIGQSAIIADVSEDRTSPVDTCMHQLGGRVYRHAKCDIKDGAWWGWGGYIYPYEYYLYPYEYIPIANSG